MSLGFRVTRTLCYPGLATALRLKEVRNWILASVAGLQVSFARDSSLDMISTV